MGRHLEKWLQKLEVRMKPPNEKLKDDVVVGSPEEARERVYCILLSSDEEREKFWALPPEERQQVVSEHRHWLHSTPEGQEELRKLSEAIKGEAERRRPYY